MLFRLLVLLALAGAAALFTLQNMSPSLSLMFLGMQTPVLPLSWWVLGAIAAGSVTTLTVSFLLGVSSFVTRQAVRSQVRRETPRRGQGQPFFRDRLTSRSGASRSPATDDDDSDAVWQDWRGYEQPRKQPDPSPETRSSSSPTGSAAVARESEDDWDQPSNLDWDEDRETSPRSPEPAPPKRTEFETRQVPKRGAQSGSAYSYSYRDSEESGAGKSEKIVDADYRVIVPPYRSLDADSPTNPPESAEDWFEESDSNNSEQPERRGRRSPS